MSFFLPAALRLGLVGSPPGVGGRPSGGVVLMTILRWSWGSGAWLCGLRTSSSSARVSAGQRGEDDDVDALVELLRPGLGRGRPAARSWPKAAAVSRVAGDAAAAR